MKSLIKFLSTSIILAAAQTVPATPITIGALSSNDDGSTDIIIDTLNNREWLRWDVIATLDYQQTLDSFLPGGAYAGYNLARQVDAQLFLNAFFSPSTSPCTVFSTNSQVLCGGGGATSSERRSLFGGNYYFTDSVAWYLSDDGVNQEVGNLYDYSTELFVTPQWGSLAATDGQNQAISAIGWLAYKTTTTVPEPSTIAIFGLGLMGLGLNRRRQRKSTQAL